MKWPLTVMLGLAAATVPAAPPEVVAIRAPQLEMSAAWDDRKEWGVAPAAALRGVDGAAAEKADVRARWNETGIFFDFVCRDTAIVAPGREDGLDHFRLGDVVEIFLARTGAASYAEVHATPAGRKSLYFFRGERSKGPVPAAAARVEVRAASIRGGWRAVMFVPWAALGADGPVEVCDFLAGRYDYAVAGGSPVLSSFPVQTGRPDFHERGRYACLVLRP
jgi:hypothetical protein